MNAFVESVFRAFLTERFGATSEGRVHFVKFEAEENIGELFGLSSKMLFGRILYEKDEERRTSESLAVKQSADVGKGILERDFYSMQFANEIHFFSRVVPTVNTLTMTKGKVESFFPKFFYGCTKAVPGYDRNVIIYENLRVLGYQMASPRKLQKDLSSEKEIDLSAVFPDYPHLSLMMRKLGQFHAHSIAAAKTNPHHFQLIGHFVLRLQENRIRKYSNLIRVCMKKFTGLLSANPYYATKLTSVEKIIENLENSLYDVNNVNSISVVCHGDFTVTNVLFKYDQNGDPVDMKMLDLGLWRLSSPVVDLVHALYINADQEMRDKHWDDLMDDYFSGLAEILTVDDLPSREKMVEEFRPNAWFAFAIASFFIPNRIAAATNLPNLFEIILSRHPNVPIVDITTDELQKLLGNYDVGGKTATEAVLNIIKDMVDRQFI